MRLTRALRFITLVGCICSMSEALSHAQSTRMITPEQSIRMALEEHGMLRSAEYEAQQARAAVQQAQSGWWPSVRSQASYTRLSGNIPPIGGQLPGVDTTFTIAPVELNRYHAEVGIEQSLFTGFRRRNQVRAAKHRAEAARARVDQQRADVAFEARQAYWTLFEALSRRDALETSLQQMEAHLENMENQVAAGTALTRDMLAARTRRSEVRLEQVQAENAVQTARLELNRLIGLPDDTRLVPRTEITLDSLKTSPDKLTADMLDDHPEVQRLRREIDALQTEVRATRGQWYPEAALTGRYIYARPNQYFFAQQDEFHGSLEAGVTLRWNLWDGGQRGAETEQAAARLHAIEAHLDHLERQLATQISRQYLEVEGARKSVGVARQIVREAEETFRVVHQQFQTGAALSADVLEAEAALRSAHARKAEAVARYATAHAALLNAAGRIW